MDLPTRDELVGIVRNVITYSGVHELFRRIPSFEIKSSDGTPVTELDIKIQQEIFKRLRDRRLTFIGEEGVTIEAGAKYALAIDPLDGTDGYIRGLTSSSCGVTILEKRDDGLWYPILAVIHEIREAGWTWSAQEHGETFERFNPLLKERVRSIPKATLPYRVTVSSWPGAPFGLHEFASSLDYAKYRNQPFGSIALGAGLIACGGTHATVFPGTSALETVAMTLIVRGAGGVATDIYGNDFDGFELGTDKSGKPDFLLPNGAIMAANRELADQLSSLITSRM